jgi:hypothetical protein
MDYLETVEVSETQRVSVVNDQLQYNDFHELVGDGVQLYVTRCDKSYNDLTTDSYQADDLNAMKEEYESLDEFEKAVEAYFFDNGRVFRKISLVGYSQSEWAVGYVYLDDDNNDTALEQGWDLKDICENVQAWFRGDVFTILLEDRVTWTSYRGDTMYTWAETDACHGVLATDFDYIKLAKTVAENCGWLVTA